MWLETTGLQAGVPLDCWSQHDTAWEQDAPKARLRTQAACACLMTLPERLHER